ncbi:MAG TPA: hypothetical protein P5205_01515 [Candidatus Paceibacterota bacterium]|nr:hypothetical protein [Verrucomicrobiota bacterium]HSA09024.1 hypothetical protein [Candidatus Paceibacterota bacterium]
MTATLALAGCSKPTGNVDTSALESSFQSAEASVKESADKAIAAIKSADYAGAVAELKKLAENAKLTPEQKQSVNDWIAKAQNAVGEAVGKAADEAGKVADDAAKAVKDLPKP